MMWEVFDWGREVSRTRQEVFKASVMSCSCIGVSSGRESKIYIVESARHPSPP